MAATFTTRVGLRKPDGTEPDSDNVNVVTDLNDNYDQIDEHLGFFVCTSSTRPTGSDRFVGRTIFETDTGFRYVWTNNNEWFLLNKIYKLKSADQNFTNTTLADVTDIQFDLVPGSWIVELIAHITGDSSNDVTLTWDMSGGVGNTGRSCLGPAGSGGDTENTVVTLNGQSISSNNSYALDSNTVAIVMEKLHLVVSSAGLLKLRASKAANTVPGTNTVLTADTRAWAERVV